MRLYLAGPYRAPDNEGIAKNILAARTVAVELWDMGHHVFSPHLNTAEFHILSKAPESAYLEFYLWIVGVMDGIVLMEGWENSRGATSEYDEARRLNKRIFYWPMDKRELRDLR